MSIDGRVCPFSMYVLYGMSHDRWIVWVGAVTPTPRSRVPVGRCARRRRVAMTTIARARGGDAVVSIAASSRRRCRRWSVSTRARRGFLAEKLRDEGAGEDEGDARAGSGDDACACGSGETYERCCGVMHRGEGADRDPEATMRARFTAYARGDAEYVVTSTHATSPDHARASLLADAKKTIKNVSFRTFTHKRSTPGKERGEYFVTYEASFTKGARGKTRVLAERARLRRDDETGEWKFVDAVALNPNTLDDVGGDPAGGARR